jgi:hypothetical protein
VVKRSFEVPSTYNVAWWNLENLFDEEKPPRRTEKLQPTIGHDLAGWTPARRDRKISQLASVIAQMNSGAGPDLLGVCEIENRFVLDLLARPSLWKRRGVLSGAACNPCATRTRAEPRC